MVKKETKVTIKKWLLVIGGAGALITILAYIKEQQNASADIAPANIYAPGMGVLNALAGLL